MFGYIREINKKYIDEFKTRLRDNLLSLIRASDTMYLKTILDEVTRLFKIMSGRLSSRKSVPKKNEFPDSVQYNNLLEALDIDLDKVYKAQSIIENDVQNLANFNSLEREKQIENLIKTQQKVYTAFLKYKKGLIGATIIKENFKNILTKDCENVQINNTKEALTLATVAFNLNREVINTEYVNCNFTKPIDEKFKLYPNNRILATGSYWKRNRNDIHFSQKEDTVHYKSLMVDKPTPDNISSCQFETVHTFNKTGKARDLVENEIGNYFHLHPSFIMVDETNSMNGKFMTGYSITGFSGLAINNIKAIAGTGLSTGAIMSAINFVKPAFGAISINKNITRSTSIDNENITKNSTKVDMSLLKPEIKLVIPFKNPDIANSLIIDFEANDGNVIPNIDIAQSFIYDSVGSKIRFIKLDKKKLDDFSKTGRYQLDFERNVVPKRIELMLSYSNSSWSLLKEYYMSGYKFEKTKTFQLITNSGSYITTTLLKTILVFVDARTPQQKEEEIANKVMTLTGVIK